MALFTAGCAALGAGNTARDLVLVPPDAQPVDRVLWNDVRTTRPLNRRMVLFEGRQRPFLLVLATPCAGLNRDSILQFDRDAPWFSPRDHAFGAVDRTLVGAPMMLCRPEALYALRDEDVRWLERSLRGSAISENPAAEHTSDEDDADACPC